MKKVAVLVLFFLGVVSQIALQAQPPGGGGRQGMQGGRPSMTEMDPEKMAGIIIHDFEYVSKKLKMDEDSLHTVLYKIIGTHNNDMYVLRDQYQETLDMMKNQRSPMAMSSSNSNEQDANRREMRDLKDQTASLNADLMSNVSSILSEKQLKKWTKYIKQKESIPAPSQTQMGGRQRGAGGQRSGGF